MNSTENTVADLEQQLAAAKHRLECERNALKESVKPIYQFTLTRHTKPGTDRLFDPSCQWYRLEGRIANKVEMEAAGHYKPFEGGLNYLFNFASGRFVMSGGGGSIFLPREEGSGTFGPPSDRALKLMTDFILDYSVEGGDFTEQMRELRPDLFTTLDEAPQSQA
jgi:hypothetical protein